MARIKIFNQNSELIPGALLEVTILYNQKNTLGIPDTSCYCLEGNKTVCIQSFKKIIPCKKNRNQKLVLGYEGNLEVTEGLTKK